MADIIDLACDLAERTLSKTIENRILPKNLESAFQCEDCGSDIPEGRRKAAKGTQYCIDCADLFERKRM